MNEFPDTAHIVVSGPRTYVLVPWPPQADAEVSDLSATLDRVQPEALALPLCSARLDAAAQDSSWRELDIVTVVRQGRALSFLAYLGFFAFMLRLGRDQPSLVARAWLSAQAEAQKRGLPLVLLDRDIEDSLRLAWRDLRLWQRLRLLARLALSLLRRGLPGDAQARALAESDPFGAALTALVAKEPRLADALFEQRARHACQCLREAPATTVLALLDRTQLQAVAQQLRAQSPNPPRPLPPRSRRPWLMPLLLIAILVPPFVLRERLPLGYLLLGWLAINAGCVLLTTLLAGARPLAILAGALCAPFSLLSPVLKASTAAALVETVARKPRVADAERLPADLRSWRRFRANPLSRVLLTFAAASLGSALGSWIGAWWLATHLISP